jgi:hypothetical protein
MTTPEFLEINVDSELVESGLVKIDDKFLLVESEHEVAIDDGDKIDAIAFLVHTPGTDDWFLTISAAYASEVAQASNSVKMYLRKPNIEELNLAIHGVDTALQSLLDARPAHPSIKTH